jgi:hypothetical protein
LPAGGFGGACGGISHADQRDVIGRHPANKKGG